MRFFDLLQRRQVPLYLSAIGLGGLGGWLLPGSERVAVAIEPALALLLFATFLAVPFGRLRAAFGDRRFLAVLGVLNFVVVPLVVFGLSRFVADDRALLMGVLLVLLAPCIDYVIVFTGLAGGAADKLLAAAPLLMLAQIVLLPVYLSLMIGPAATAAIEVAPFVEAFVKLIVLPLLAAVLVQRIRHRVARAVEAVMVPLMMITLAVVIASQIRGVGDRLGLLVPVLVIFVAFALIMNALGVLSARAARLVPPTARALTFSGVTRNSLVVLPLALALPGPLVLAAVVVVSQTLVELLAMVVMVRLVPRLLPDRPEGDLSQG